MGLETELVESVQETLSGWGVECTIRYERSPLVRADATLALRWGGARQRFAVHALPAVRLAAVLEAAGASAMPVLIVAPWISPRMGGQLREIGIAYLDSVGNASLRFGTVLIEVSGRKRPGPPEVEPVETGLAKVEASEVEATEVEATEVEPVETGASRQARRPDARRPDARRPDAPVRSGRLLTPANRRVIAALVADPALEVAPLRELAAAAGVSVGQAHKTVTLLAEAGYHRDHLDAAQRAALQGVLDAVADFEV